MTAADMIYQLPSHKNVHKYINECYMNDIPLLVIKHPVVKGIVSLQGGQLLSWIPKNQQPVLWLSHNAIFNLGTAIRGGIPFCWPWFGKAGNPSHGFARNMLWNLVEVNDKGNAITLTLQLKDNQQSRQVWPHSFTILAHIYLGEHCEVTLEAQGDFSTTAALHSYFEVGDIEKIAIDGLGEHYTDDLTKEKVALTEENSLTFNQPLTHIYSSPNSISLIHDPVYNRTIQVEHIHATDVVVWTPWLEGATQFEDMIPEGYKTMVCVETAHLQQPLIATPAKNSQLKTIIRLQELKS